DFGSSGGVFAVGVRLTDGGHHSSATVSLLVANVAPTLGRVVAGDNFEGQAGELHGGILEPGPLETHTLVGGWGEGTKDTFAYAPGTTDFHESHVYRDDRPSGTPADVYPILLTVEDDDGGSTTTTTHVTIVNVPPRLTDVSATPTQEGRPTHLT